MPLNAFHLVLLLLYTSHVGWVMIISMENSLLRQIIGPFQSAASQPSNQTKTTCLVDYILTVNRKPYQQVLCSQLFSFTNEFFIQLERHWMMTGVPTVKNTLPNQNKRPSLQPPRTQERTYLCVCGCGSWFAMKRNVLKTDLNIKRKNRIPNVLQTLPRAAPFLNGFISGGWKMIVYREQQAKKARG